MSVSFDEITMGVVRETYSKLEKNGKNHMAFRSRNVKERQPTERPRRMWKKIY